MKPTRSNTPISPPASNKPSTAKFYHPDTGLYGNGSQTSLSCALYQGLADPDIKPRVLSNLVANIEQSERPH